MSTCPTTPLEPVITLHEVHKRFKNTHAVNGISLTIRRGEYVALLGPNGAGKTTLVEMIEGLQNPDSGQIAVLGKNWQHHGSWLRGKIGLALQETRLIDKLTVFETLELFGSFYRLHGSRLQDVLQLIKLTDKRNALAETLSGGQKQRLALGLAILNQPEILILDEPTVGLDPHARRDLWQILNDLKQRCTTLILTTHYMEEAAYLCSRICIMHKGRVLTDGSLAELSRQHGQGEIIEFQLPAGSVPQPLFELPGIKKYQWDDIQNRGSLTVEQSAIFLPHFFAAAQKAGLQVQQISARQQTLDDMFISLTGRHLDE